MAFAPAPLPSLSTLLGPGYAVAADAAAYALTGSDANLYGPGELTTGAVEAPAPLPSLASLLALVPNKVLAAEAGAFSFLFAPSLSDVAITGEVGAITLGGQAAGLLKGRTPLIGGPGTFTMTGAPATLTGPNEYRLVGEAAAFIVEGPDVPLALARKLVGELTAYALTGQDSEGRRGAALTAEAGAYVMTGWPASLSRSGGTARYGRRGRKAAGVYPRRTNTVF